MVPPVVFHNTAVFRYFDTVVNNSCAVVVPVTPRTIPGKFEMERFDFGGCGQVDLNCYSCDSSLRTMIGPDGSLNTKFHTPHGYEHT